MGPLPFLSMRRQKQGSHEVKSQQPKIKVLGAVVGAGVLVTMGAVTVACGTVQTNLTDPTTSGAAPTPTTSSSTSPPRLGGAGNTTTPTTPAGPPTMGNSSTSTTPPSTPHVPAAAPPLPAGPPPFA